MKQFLDGAKGLWLNARGSAWKNKQRILEE